MAHCKYFSPPLLRLIFLNHVVTVWFVSNPLGQSRGRKNDLGKGLAALLVFVTLNVTEYINDELPTSK